MNTLIATIALFMLCGSSPAIPLHQRICEDFSVPGKLQDGECVKYAKALSVRLAKAHIHGRIIKVTWWEIGHPTRKWMHEFVTYRAQGSRWVVDNEREDPIRVNSHCDFIDLAGLVFLGHR